MNFFLINILSNALKKNYFFVILRKLIKRFEKDNSVEARKWAEQNAKLSTEDFCCLIDRKLFNQIETDLLSIKKDAKKKLSKLTVALGGGGNYILLYFLICKIKPLNVVETGVAAGWSTLTILRALKKNNKGKLYSSDFPYFRLKNPEHYVGYLAKNENINNNWYLDIRGDDKALPEIKKKLRKNDIDLLHYDSDKSYSGRAKALKVLETKINSKTIIIFDDIQDNFHFRDYVEKTKNFFYVLRFGSKFIGIVGYDFLVKK